MSLYVNVPISTEVIESNPDCQIRGFYENQQLVIEIDTRYQNHLITTHFLKHDGWAGGTHP
jgi:hypothetical protein